MKDKDKVQPAAEAAGSQQEPYTPPLLTKHEHLRTLTGKSGEKSSDEGPNEHSDNGNHGGHGNHGRHVGKEKH